jgi:hypothetical protein
MRGGRIAVKRREAVYHKTKYLEKKRERWS